MKPSVAVFRLEPKHGVPPGAADLLTDTLLNEVRGSGAFSRVVSPAEIAVLMAPEQQQFLVRCASDECALVDNELAGALGVSHILVGNLGKLGNSYLLNLRLLDVQSSVLLASLSERAKGDTEEALLDLVRAACKGRDQPMPEACRRFNAETADGRQMQAYSDLLGQAIRSMIQVKEEKDLDSLFTGGRTTALVNAIAGLDDFELITFLVIQGSG